MTFFIKSSGDIVPISGPSWRTFEAHLVSTEDSDFVVKFHAVSTTIHLAWGTLHAFLVTSTFFSFGPALFTGQTDFLVNVLTIDVNLDHLTD